MLAHAVARDADGLAHRAWAQAVRFGFAGTPGSRGADADAWQQAWRLTRLADHTDLFLALTRGDRWMRRHVRVEGEWPRADPFLAVTSHWGAGLWSLRHLHRAGNRARFLSRRLDPEELRPDPWLERYARLRVWMTARELGAPLIYTGGASAEIATTWARGQSVVALFDVPAPEARSTIVLPLGRVAMRVPLGLLRLACEHRIPVLMFSVAVDHASGGRTLRIGTARTYDDPQTLGLELASHLERLLELDSAAWHLWPYAPALLLDPASAAA